MGYFGLDNDGLNNMLRDIDCNLDIKDITEIHKNSILIFPGFANLK